MPQRPKPAQTSEPAHETTQHGVTVITGGPTPNMTSVRVSDEETRAFVLRLVGRHGDPERALFQIAGEQLKYRKRAQRAEADVESLKTQVPPQGAVVLTGDTAKAFQALNHDGKFDLTKVGEQLKELTELRSTRGQESRQAQIATAAGDRYKVKVLARLLGDTPLEFKKVLVPDPEDEDGMIEKSMPYVKVGDTLEPLDTWLKREHADFMPIITVEPAEEEDELNLGTTDAEQQRAATKKKESSSTPAVRMPRQTPAGTGEKGTKGQDKEILKAVDRTMSIHMTPGQRRKAEAGS